MKETHTKVQLQDFRRKLVKSAKTSAKANYFYLSGALEGNFIDWPSLAKQVSDWYFDTKRTNNEKAAMWQNSIADIDRRIKELK